MTTHESRSRQHGRAVKAVSHTGRWIALASVTILITVVAGLWTLTSGQTDTAQPDQAAAASTGHFMDPHEVRSVKVAPISEPMVLDQGGKTTAVVTLLEGKIPQGATSATVQTDENCAPDDSGPTKGVSHCHNRVQFDNGTTAVIQHHHLIAKVGCFTPGQVIRFV